MTDREQQILADEIVAAFVAKCEKLWPGCRVTRREPAAVSILRGYAEQQQKFLQQQGSPPDVPAQPDKEVK